MPLTTDEIRRFCLDLPAAVEEYPFDSSPELCTFKVVGKVFVFTQLTAPPPLHVALKCDPQIAVALRNSHPAITPGWHLNKRHWNTVTIDGSLPDEQVLEMIQDSFDLVVDSLPKHQRIRLR
ncbi:putative DNA-binding protein (MmcQ/YjbR family) [Nakamurella sp. UYEF19]|uniref:MmcQ/YjbR family DNA-binding protein n=1 Tax=Nakamurella sp. UYEF19 TaxID=1756392 RepID=UPI00339936B7